MFSGLLAALMLVGCAGADSVAKRQLEDFRKDIDRIQADNEKLNDRLTNLETATTSRQTAGTSSASPSDRPPLNVVRLTPNGGREDSAEGEDDGPDDGTATVIRAEGNHEPTVQAGSEDAAKAMQASREYDAAIGLVKKKKYDEALEALAGYLARYPGEANADNAMYWRGECYYAKRDYARAAEQFDAVITRFPQGSKVPDALLKLGLSQRAAGERDKAKDTFGRLRKSYPTSDAAKKIPRE